MATITYTVTVADSGYGNVYYIDGVANPALTFTRGNTYVFDLSDNSNSGHPLAFKDLDGNSYTTGVTTTGTAGSSGANVSIVVAAATLVGLRYYCTVHGNVMGNTITVPVLDAFVGLYGSGEYGSAAFGVVPGAVILPSVSATGTVNNVNATISVTLSGVSATGLSGTVTAVNDSSLTLGSVFATGFVNTLSENPSEAITGVSATGSIGTVFAQAFFGANDAIYGTGRYGTAIYGSTTPTINAPSILATGAVASVGVGASQTLSGVFATSIIGEIRTIPFIVDSVSAEFNPLKPFTASGDAQLSTAENKFGVSSLFLGGTSDFVTTSYTSSLLTNSEWAVDFWVYSSGLTSQTAHLWDAQNSNSGFALRISSGTLQVIKDNSITRSVSGQLSNNTWHHIRLQRRFAFTEVFVDGFQRGQQAGAGYNAHTYVIGAKENGSEEFTGYIDEFRASTPTGLSATNFTPETEAYSLDINTAALLHFDGTNGSTTIENETNNVINLVVTGAANVDLASVSATGEIEQLQVNGFEIDVSENLDSVSATGGIGTLTHSNTHSISSIVGTFSIGDMTVTGVTFNFIATDYDRKRVVYVPRQNTAAERRVAA